MLLLLRSIFELWFENLNIVVRSEFESRFVVLHFSCCFVFWGAMVSLCVVCSSFYVFIMSFCVFFLCVVKKRKGNVREKRRLYLKVRGDLGDIFIMWLNWTYWIEMNENLLKFEWHFFLFYFLCDRLCLSYYLIWPTGNQDWNPNILDRRVKIDSVCCDFWFPISFFEKEWALVLWDIGDRQLEVAKAFHIAVLSSCTYCSIWYGQLDAALWLAYISLQMMKDLNLRHFDSGNHERKMSLLSW